MGLVNNSGICVLGGDPSLSGYAGETGGWFPFLSARPSAGENDWVGWGTMAVLAEHGDWARVD
jgi:hypothetical protein